MKNIYNKTIIASMINTSLILIIGASLMTKATFDNPGLIYLLGLSIIIEGLIFQVKTKKTKDEVLSPYNQLFGLVNFILGIFIIANPFKLEDILIVGSALYFIFRGVFKTSYAIVLREAKCDEWLVSLIMTILIMMSGLIILINPFIGSNSLDKTIGLFLLLYSILDITISFIVKKHSTKFIKTKNNKK